jgi:REP element-mobilizing transposase RayT
LDIVSMPRGPRLDAPGVVHHVRARGIERRKIFRDDVDREDFLERLALVTEGERAFVYAWALIPNHFHLAIRTGTMSLAGIMRRLLTGYAVSFNLRHKRHGHLFQNRYKSTVVDEEAYLLALVRYIHRNPLRAGLVRSMDALAQYPWTGHASLMGVAKHSFQDHDEILRRFGQRQANARKSLARFVSDHEAAKLDDERFKGGGLIRSAGGIENVQNRSRKERERYDDRVLGDGEFVESILRRAEEYEQVAEKTKKDREKQFEKLTHNVCHRLKIAPSLMGSGSRAPKVVQARMIINYLATNVLGYSGVRLSEIHGVSRPAVSQSIPKGEKAFRELGWTVELILG